MTDHPDLAARIRKVREHIDTETQKLPAVDHNGRPLPPDEPAPPAAA